MSGKASYGPKNQVTMSLHPDSGFAFRNRSGDLLSTHRYFLHVAPVGEVSDRFPSHLTVSREPIG